MEEFVNNNIAVFIDFQNIAYTDKKDLKQIDLHTRQVKSEMRSAISYLKSRGRLIVKKAYADWAGQFATYRQQMLEDSIELTEVPSQYSGKNSADIKLSVDALEIALSKSYIDTFVVISGDSDFAPLISMLREHNKYVIVIGRKGNLSALLKGYCDELKNFNDIIEEEEDDDIADENDIRYAYKLLKEAANYFSERGKKVNTGGIKNHLVQLDSSFSQAKYGFKMWNDFLRQAEKDKIIRMEQHPKDKNAFFILPYSTTSKK
jgi:uncharacterized protein (TIGR00288 family)